MIILAFFFSIWCHNKICQGEINTWTSLQAHVNGGKHRFRFDDLEINLFINNCFIYKNKNELYRIINLTNLSRDAKINGLFWQSTRSPCNAYECFTLHCLTRCVETSCWFADVWYYITPRLMCSWGHPSNCQKKLVSENRKRLRKKYSVSLVLMTFYPS